MASGAEKLMKPAGGPAVTVDDEGGAEELEDINIYNDYECRSINFGVPHPSEIAEPRGLSAVSLPAPSYPLRESLDKCNIIQSGKLSSLQLEGVQYACQRHQVILSGGARAGFFLGDGAGVGKGRQISGMIADNLARGRPQHVWLSTSSDLRLDAQRDLNDLGLHCKVIDGCQDLDANTKAFGMNKDFKSGVLFSTYSTLIGSARGTKASRIDQIIAWCGGETFDGLLIFDECHRAKNFQVGEKEEASSKTSKCVIELQKRLPLARVVYASATGVTELANLAYCERLGLWGEGCPFSDFEAFLKVVSKKGIFFLEMLAMELKREGAYVSRGLSFKRAEFETINVALTESQTKIYDQAAVLWRDLRLKMQDAAALTNASGRLMAVYWGCQQRFFKQLIVSLKVDTVCAEAKAALAAGFAVVIGLQNTGEASMSRKMLLGGSACFLSSARESMIALIEDHFPTTVLGSAGKDREIEGVGLEEGDSQTAGGSVLSALPTPQKDARAALLPEGSMVLQCVQMKEELLRRVLDLDLPNSALDMLLDNLGGPSKVAEMTGRAHRIVRKENGQVVHQQRGNGETDVERVNVTECRHFQESKKLVGIISDAASVGISLHAKRGGKNERRRVHLTIELPWSADKAVQQLGRTHRSNQSSAPIYKLVVTDLGGEKRFCSAVARRLQSLGALTKGDRRAATGQDLQEFNIQTSMGAAALKKVFASIDEGLNFLPNTNSQGLNMEALQEALEMIGLGPVGRKENETTNVGRFLSRLLGLPVYHQNFLFNYFMDTLLHDKTEAEAAGQYSDAIRDLYAGSKVTLVKSEDIYTDPITSAACSRHTLSVDKGMSWDDALARLHQAQKSAGLKEPPEAFKGGFYETKNNVPPRNATGWLLAIQKEDCTGEYNVWRPNSGSGSMLTYDDLKGRSKRSEELAEKAWTKMYEESKTWDEKTDKGARMITVHLLAGSLIPVWDHIHEVVQRASARGGAGVTQKQADMKVVRMSTSGQSFIGLRLPIDVIKSVKKKLDEHADLLAGRLLKVCMEPNVLALVPVMVAQHYLVPGDYKGKAYVGSKVQLLKLSEVTMRIFKGTVTLGITDPKSGVQLPFLAPKGSNGEFITREPFCVPVPVQLGDITPAHSVKGSKVEVVTEINEKVLKKALTPAATMLSFFKTKGPLEPAQAEEGEEIECGSGDGDKSGASRDSRSHSQNSQGGAGQKRGAFFSSTSQSSSSSSDTKKARVTSASVSGGKLVKSKNQTSQKGGIGTFFGGGPGSKSAISVGKEGKLMACDLAVAEVDLTVDDSD